MCRRWLETKSEVVTIRDRIQSPSIPRPTQGAGAVGGVGVFIEFVGKRAVVAGFGEVVPRRWIRGEEGLTGAKPVVEEFARQRISKAEGDEAGGLSIFCTLTPFPQPDPVSAHSLLVTLPDKTRKSFAPSLA